MPSSSGPREIALSEQIERFAREVAPGVREAVAKG